MLTCVSTVIGSLLTQHPSPVFSVFLSTAERARVGLAPLPGMKGTDYINASYIMVSRHSVPLSVILCCPRASLPGAPVYPTVAAITM